MQLKELHSMDQSVNQNVVDFGRKIVERAEYSVLVMEDSECLKAEKVYFL